MVRRLRHRRGGAAPAAQIVRGRTWNAGAFRCLRLPQRHDPLNGYRKALTPRRRPFFCSVSLVKGQEMFCHYRRSAPATKQRDKMCLWSTAGTPNPPGQAPPDTRLGSRSHSSLNPTPFNCIPAAPGGLANVSRPHSKLRTRSPLSDEFCAGNMPLVTT